MPQPWTERAGRPIRNGGRRAAEQCLSGCVWRDTWRESLGGGRFCLESRRRACRPDRESMHRGRTPGAVRRTPGTAAELECRIAASPEPEHGRFRTTELETRSNHGRSQPTPICRQSAHRTSEELEVSAAAAAAARQGAPGVRGSPAGMPPWQARLEHSREPSRSGSSLGDVPALKTTVWRMVTSVHAKSFRQGVTERRRQTGERLSKGVRDAG